VVGQVVGTMQGISESTRKIGDIIGMIDGIALDKSRSVAPGAAQGSMAPDREAFN
jgi:hypothetical protein